MKNIILALSALLLTSTTTQAIVLTFDDLGTGGAVSNGYGGLNWSNYNILHAVNYQKPSGYFNGLVSGDYVAFNNSAFTASVSSATPFDLNSAYFTAAWNTGLNVTVKGFFNSAETYSQTFTVDTDAPTLINFNFLGIDRATFSSSGGINAGLSGGGEHFAVDNMTVNAVPEVSMYPLLLGLGSLCFAAAGRRIRR